MGNSVGTGRFLIAMYCGGTFSILCCTQYLIWWAFSYFRPSDISSVTLRRPSVHPESDYFSRLHDSLPQVLIRLLSPMYLCRSWIIMVVSMFAFSFMVVMVTITTAVWLFIPFEYKLISLYIIFPVTGFVIGGMFQNQSINIISNFFPHRYLTYLGIGPYAVRLVESVTPVTGRISCIFMMLCGAGDFVIVLVNGKLIQMYGAQVIHTFLVHLTMVYGHHHNCSLAL